MIYTEVETYPATLVVRWHMLGLVWRTAGEPDVPAKARRKVRRMAVWNSIKPSVRAATYVVNRNED